MLPCPDVNNVKSTFSETHSTERSKETVVQLRVASYHWNNVANFQDFHKNSVYKTQKTVEAVKTLDNYDLSARNLMEFICQYVRKVSGANQTHQKWEFKKKRTILNVTNKNPLKHKSSLIRQISSQLLSDIQELSAGLGIWFWSPTPPVKKNMNSPWSRSPFALKWKKLKHVWVLNNKC